MVNLCFNTYGTRAIGVRDNDAAICQTCCFLMAPPDTPRVPSQFLWASCEVPSFALSTTLFRQQCSFSVEFRSQLLF
jgi:hypothetical protein